MALKSSKKVAQNFYCKDCDYITSRKYNFDKHLLTAKHKMALNGTKMAPPKVAEKTLEKRLYICNECNKEYKQKCSLYKHINQNHKSSKNKNEIIFTQNELQLYNQVKELEFKNKALEDNLKNSNNQTFNQTINNNLSISIYLDKHYGDAMNLKDFVNEIKLSVEDLVFTKNNGYIDGVSNILIKNLDEIELKNRPIQCISKNNDFYIKDEDKWEKDGGKLKEGINIIANKQIEEIKKWEENNKGWENTDKGIDEYMKIIKEIMGTKKGNNIDDIKKILRKKIDNLKIDRLT